MSDFLHQLKEISDERNDAEAIYEEIEKFGERYFDNLAEIMVKELKTQILNIAKKGEFAYENGKKVIKGSYKIDLYAGRVQYALDVDISNEKINWQKKLSEMNLTSPVLFFSQTPRYSCREVLAEEQKKILFFNVTAKKKKMRISFRLDSSFVKVMKIFKEKAAKEGIDLSGINYGYTHMERDRETGKYNNYSYLTGLRLSFVDYESTQTWEWHWTKSEIVLKFEEPEICFSVNY